MRQQHRNPAQRRLFQSAPAIAGGRCDTRGAGLDRCLGFNPRPPLLAGDAPLGSQVGIGLMFQSAPAIAGGRCLAVMTNTNRTQSFNPRPPLLAGDAHTQGTRYELLQVSIRARHCWRAMRQVTKYVTRWRKFQSAPAIAGGRCAPERGAAWADRCFNPRPPLLAGDAPACRASSSRAGCFNPRPPLLAGDAQSRAGRLAANESFQSAPAIAGGRCMTGRVIPAYWMVSIRARHCWRAMRPRHC